MSSVEEMGEIAGHMHAALDAFTQRLGEAMAELRLGTSEQRAQGTKALEHLQDIAAQARTVQAAHQNLVKLIEQQWPARLDAAARNAGEAQAKTFGEGILKGMEGQLAAASQQLERSAQHLQNASRALRWKTAILFGSVSLGFALIVGLSQWAVIAHLRSQMRALSQQRDRMTQTVELLNEVGGKLDIARCAPNDRRLCARIGPERFGPRDNYAPVRLKGDE